MITSRIPISLFGRALFRNLTLVAALIGMGLSQLARAEEEICRQLLGQPTLDQRMDQLYSAGFGDQLVNELRPRVEAIYQADPEMGAESLQEIFNLYMGRRLEGLPGSIRQIVWDVIENHTQVKAISTDKRASTHKPEFTGYADSEKGVVVAIPQKAFHTAFDYVIRVHELEHIIQYQAIGRKPFRKFHPKRFLNSFFLERGAMRSEAAFLLLFPKEYIISLEDESIKLTEPSAHWFFTQAIRNIRASDDVTTYVEMMWRADRYPHSQFLKAHLITYMNWGLTFTFFSSPWWTAWIKALGH